MTKAYLKFPPKRISFLPKMTSRRFKFDATEFITHAYKGDAGDDDKDARKELLEKIQGMIDSSLATRATVTELNSIRASMPAGLADLPLEALREMTNTETGVMRTVANLSLEIQRLRTTVDERPQDMSIRAQIKRWLESPNDEGGSITVKDTVIALRAKKRVDLKPLELELNMRAANSPMLPSNTYNGSAYLPKIEYLPGIVDVIRPMYTFWNYIKKGATSSAALVWINKQVPGGSGGANWIAPGVLKPAVSFTIDTQISNAKKIAANEKVAIELLDDIDGLTTWVEDELLYQVYQKASLTLMNNAGDANTPTGIQALSVANAFAALGLTTLNPNNWDVIRSCVAQFRAANFTGYEVTFFINPIDMGNMVMTKADNQGQTFIPPVTGATIVEDNNIPVGSFQAALLDLYKIAIYKGFSMVWGLENDDFTKNLRTVIGEMRIHQYFSENHTGAFIFDTFANAIVGLGGGA